MNYEIVVPLDAKMQAAIAEMKGLILRHYPDATFEIGIGEDPVGMHLKATIDREDLWDVIELCSERLVDLQVDEGIPLYVIPTRPLARTMEMLERTRERTP